MTNFISQGPLWLGKVTRPSSTKGMWAETKHAFSVMAPEHVTHTHTDHLGSLPQPFKPQIEVGGATRWKEAGLTSLLDFI